MRGQIKSNIQLCLLVISFPCQPDFSLTVSDPTTELSPATILATVYVLRSHTSRVSNHDRRIMSEYPGSNEISSDKGSRSIEVYFPILFYKYFGTLITGRLMEDGRLIGGHLMEVQLYTEWDDNHVCIINQ